MDRDEVGPVGDGCMAMFGGWVNRKAKRVKRTCREVHAVLGAPAVRVCISHRHMWRTRTAVERQLVSVLSAHRAHLEGYPLFATYHHHHGNFTQ